MLNVDLADFFPAIHFGRVRGRLMRAPFDFSIWQAGVIANLCCLDSRLPQGAPSSPILSNLVCGSLDRAFLLFAKQNGAHYTRYADDLTFSWYNNLAASRFVSHTRGLPTSTATPSDELVRIISSHGFSLNQGKTSYRTIGDRREVTGLIVNERVNVKRTYVREVRAILHAIDKFGWAPAASAHFAAHPPRVSHANAVKAFQRIVRGKLEFIRYIKTPKDQVYLRLAASLRTHLPKYRPDDVFVLPEVDVTKRDVFLCHASEDKKQVVRPLKKALEAAQVSCWLDETRIGWGDSLIDEISKGLEDARMVVIVLSKDFLRKNWPRAEMRAALTKELKTGSTRVLPLLVGDDAEISEIMAQVPLLADKKYEKWSSGSGQIVAALKAALSKKPTPRGTSAGKRKTAKKKTAKKKTAKKKTAKKKTAKRKTIGARRP